MHQPAQRGTSWKQFAVRLPLYVVVCLSGTAACDLYKHHCLVLTRALLALTLAVCRYYRLMATQSSSSDSSSSSALSQELEAARAALAFKAVAVCWREQEGEVMRLCVTQQVLDFLYLGALWYVTGDMTAPCVAALLANAVDYHEMWTAIQSTSTGGPGGSGPRGRKRPHKGSSLRE